jgi:hypothetical protein
MRARSDLTQEALVEKVQETLAKLGYTFRRSEGNFLTEFEVMTPCRMLITVEDITHEQIGYPLRSRIRVESAIEVRRLIPSTESADLLRRHASAFVASLRARLPREPWKGIGVTSHSEKDNWERLADIE